MTFPVVLDACVLVPHPLFDTLLRLADAGAFRPLWSERILGEVERTLIVKRAVSSAKAQRRIQQMCRAFPEAMVEDFDDLISSMTNDRKDRHVLAAAVASGAGGIVTANLKDFPTSSVVPYSIEAVHSGAFLLDQVDVDPDRVRDCLQQQRLAYSDPSMSIAEFYRAFRATVPRFARVAESLSRGRDVGP